MSVTVAQTSPTHQSVRRWWAVGIASAVYILVLVESYLQVGPSWLDRLTRVWPALLIGVVGLAIYAAVSDFMSARRSRVLRSIEVAAAVAAAVVGLLWAGCALALVLFGGDNPFWFVPVAVTIPVLPVTTLWLVSWLSRPTTPSAAAESAPGAVDK